MFKLNLETAKEPEIKLPTSTGSSEKQEFQKNMYFFIDYTKAYDCVDQKQKQTNKQTNNNNNKTGENSERDGNTRPPYLPPEKSVCRSRSNS